MFTSHTSSPVQGVRNWSLCTCTNFGYDNHNKLHNSLVLIIFWKSWKDYRWPETRPVTQYYKTLACSRGWGRDVLRLQKRKRKRKYVTIIYHSLAERQAYYLRTLKMITYLPNCVQQQRWKNVKYLKGPKLMRAIRKSRNFGTELRLIFVSCRFV
jgi:hypothetical protein